jgi:DNA-3-methyladenine glycosylase
MILERGFYQKDTLEVARALLGQILVRRTPEGETRGIIVETEAYLGEADPAAHSYRGKSDRVRVQYGPAGCAYVYLIYGMYNCLNITTGPLGRPEVVLLRALEPCGGFALMQRRRRTERRKALCSGPGKLCMAMDITRELYGADLCGQTDGLWVEQGQPPEAVATSPRINIDYAGAAKDWPWRFTIRGNPYISK